MKRGMVRKSFIFILVFVLVSHVYPEEKRETTGPPKDKRLIEVSFGAMLVYIDQPFVDRDSGESTEQKLPVPTALFILELLAFSKISFPLIVDIPLEPVREIENGEVREKHLTSVAGAGINWTMFGFRAFNLASLRGQAGIVGCYTLNSTREEGNYFMPMPYFRFHILADSGFSLYLGATFAFHNNTYGILYGVGHQF